MKINRPGLDITIAFRVTEETGELYLEAARQSGFSWSRYCRELMAAGYESRRVAGPKPVTPKHRRGVAA